MVVSNTRVLYLAPNLVIIKNRQLFPKLTKNYRYKLSGFIRYYANQKRSSSTFQESLFFDKFWSNQYDVIILNVCLFS